MMFTARAGSPVALVMVATIALANVLTLGAPAGAGGSGPTADDEVLRAVPVPDDEDPQGEISLLRRGDDLVVQTFLYTRLLRRAVAEIASREAEAWLEGEDGFDDSARYLEALRAAEVTVRSRHARLDERRRHRQKLVIELVSGPERADLSIYALPVTAPAERAALERGELLARPAVSRAYVERDMRIICEESLGFDLDELERSRRPMPDPQESAEPPS